MFQRGKRKTAHQSTKNPKKKKKEHQQNFFVPSSTNCFWELQLILFWDGALLRAIFRPLYSFSVTPQRRTALFSVFPLIPRKCFHSSLFLKKNRRSFSLCTFLPVSTKREKLSPWVQTWIPPSQKTKQKKKNIIQTGEQKKKRFIYKGKKKKNGGVTCFVACVREGGGSQPSGCRKKCHKKRKTPTKNKRVGKEKRKKEMEITEKKRLTGENGKKEKNK